MKHNIFELQAAAKMQIVALHDAGYTPHEAATILAIGIAWMYDQAKRSMTKAQYVEEVTQTIKDLVNDGNFEKAARSQPQ